MAVTEEIERLTVGPRLDRRRSREVAQRAGHERRCSTTAGARSAQGRTSIEEILRVVV